MWQSPPMKLILASMASIIAAPGLAMAGPVNLKCVLDAGDDAVPLEVQLNETEGTGTWYWPRKNFSAKRDALFSPSNVTFGPFKIDRRSLTIVRENDALMVKQGAMPETTSGKCEIDNSERAF